MNTLRIVNRLAIIWLAVVATAACASGADPVNGPKTPLDLYVAKEDPAYEWKVVKTVPGDGYTTFVVDLKSQSWRTVPEVDRAVWQHWLVVVKPDIVKHPTAFLTIGGGRNGSPAPDAASAQSVTMAKTTNSVVAELKMVPNQPLVLNKDGKPRSEDDLLAEGWVKYMDTGDPLWIPRLPMVKSAVRAMDTVTALLVSEKGGKLDVKTFVVAGGSKRGWTTWLTGAVDKRVVAIVPIVIDVVNVEACSINHFCAYGFWAPAIGDYTQHKIFERSGTKEHNALMRIEDPYFYRDRLTMPKYVVNAAGDQYFPPDSSKFYFGDLTGPKFLRYVPNADHSLRESDAQDSILAFYQAVLNKGTMPKFSWEMAADGSIRVKTEDKPREVNLWQATNPKARDFRLEAIGKAYKKSNLEPGEGGVYVAKVAKPEAGWTAFFVELVFESGGKVPFKFTTQVSIVPDVLPHKIEEAKKQTDVKPFIPEPILSGGVVLPLYPADSPQLKKGRIHEAERYNTTLKDKSDQTKSVLNIHNPSIEVHLVGDKSENTGAAVIVAPGGGHQILWVGPEGGDFVPFFKKHGVSTIILRNRLRVDGYDPKTDAVNDAFQAIRLVRAHAAEWKLDPAKIGIVGFSAGAELAAPAALFFDDFERNNSDPADLLAKVSARPDFVGVIYPGPTPFTRDPATKIPRNVPPSFIASAGSGDKVHALWATDYFTAMLKAGVPNLEIHIYGNGGHGGGLSTRGGIPFGTWTNRYVDWFKDLGFLEKPGKPTKAAADVEAYAKKSVR